MTSAPEQPAGQVPATLTAQGRVLFRIETFSARYDPIEDRIRLDAVDAEGAKQSLLLTHRMLDHVVPVLVSDLEEKSPQGVPKMIAQGMKQLQARQIRQADPAAPSVQPEARTPVFLCRTVHMQKSAQGVAMTFTDDQSIDAVMLLSNANLRAVLDIFAELYRKGDWSDTVFPDWMQGDDPDLSPTPSVARLN